MSTRPRLAPSRRNWTLATPTSSDAFAARATVPERVAPAAGAVSDTVGGVVSGGGGGGAFATVTVIEGELAVFPAASRATAVSTCEPGSVDGGAQPKGRGLGGSGQ